MNCWRRHTYIEETCHRLKALRFHFLHAENVSICDVKIAEITPDEKKTRDKGKETKRSKVPPVTPQFRLCGQKITVGLVVLQKSKYSVFTIFNAMSENYWIGFVSCSRVQKLPI